jgi:hypothetical protein
LLLGGGFTIGEYGKIGRCGQYQMFRAVSEALLWFGSAGGLLGSTPSENEVSGQFYLPVRSDLRLLLELCDAFVAMQSGTNCLDSGLLHWDWLCGLLGPTPSENEVSE